MSLNKTTYRDWTEGNRTRLQSATGSRTLSGTYRSVHRKHDRSTSAELDATRRNVEHAIGSRVDEIQQMKNDLEHTAAACFSETNILEQHKDKIERSLQQTQLPLDINRQCQQWREGRFGVDLVDDDVDRALEQEHLLLVQMQAAYKKTIEDIEGQLRGLRAAKYKIDSDVKDKREAEGIDTSCRSLKTTSAGLDRYLNSSKDIPSAVDPSDWFDYSKDNIENAEREIQASKDLRQYIDQQVCDYETSLRDQWSDVDTAFNVRISESTEAQHRLKDSLAETQTEIDSQDKSIRDLNQAIKDKDAPLMLAETRLHKRSGRPNVELVRDSVHAALVDEANLISEVCEKLRLDKSQAEEAHRALLRDEQSLMKDIDTKINSINIDNQCMQRRQHYKYRPL